MTAALPTMDRWARLERVRTELAARELSSLVVTTPTNIRWLTGFTGSNGTVVVTADALVLVTDSRYTEVAEEQLANAWVEAELSIGRDTWDRVAASGLGTAVAVEADHLTIAAEAELGDALDGAVTRPVRGLVETLRRTKDDGEIARLARAAAIADAAVADQEERIHRGGGSERALARAIEDAMLEHGADGRSFPTIVASGPNGARPHAVPGERIIEPGDVIVVDCGAEVDGYGSDMTRTFLCGDERDPLVDERYEAVRRAQAAGVAAVRAGVPAAEVDAACRESLAAEGLADAFVHGTGHAIGLDIHEQPFVSATSVDSLSAGLVVTVEPGVYLPGWGGIRIEDSVVVTDHGCEPITHFPKGLTPWPPSPPTT